MEIGFRQVKQHIRHTLALPEKERKYSKWLRRTKSKIQIVTQKQKVEQCQADKRQNEKLLGKISGKNRF